MMAMYYVCIEKKRYSYSSDGGVMITSPHKTIAAAIAQGKEMLSHFERISIVECHRNILKSIIYYDDLSDDWCGWGTGQPMDASLLSKGVEHDKRTHDRVEAVEATHELGEYADGIPR